MTQQHTKSPCCQGIIYQYGQRRRQCSVCKKTWRIRQKKRGRKPHRYSFNSLLRYLDNRDGPLIHQAPKRKLTAPAFCARMRKNLKKFISQTPWPDIPNGPLVAIADAFTQTIKEERWTTYLILLRSLRSNKAVITPPHVHQGTEGGIMGWYEAFNKLPNAVKKRIVGLICDGRRSLVLVPKKEGWILQRCHFHLLYRIANYVRTGPLSHNRRLGLKIKSLVNVALVNPDEDVAKKAVSQLRILLPTFRSRGLRFVLNGFIKNYSDFRSYLHFPEFNLPTTSNSAESLIGLVRDLEKRARGFRSVQSFGEWTIALCKHRKFIICNGKHFPPN